MTRPLTTLMLVTLALAISACGGPSTSEPPPPPPPSVTGTLSGTGVACLDRVGHTASFTGIRGTWDVDLVEVDGLINGTLAFDLKPNNQPEGTATYAMTARIGAYYSDYGPEFGRYSIVDVSIQRVSTTNERLFPSTLHAGTLTLEIRVDRYLDLYLEGAPSLCNYYATDSTMLNPHLTGFLKP